MAEISWTEQVIDDFFRARKSPTRNQCDELALSISDASALHPVDVPGSLSYTVVCARTKCQDNHDNDSVVVSFRESSSRLDNEMVSLAQTIHGDGCLVPYATNHGIMSGSDPPFGIYTMPLLPGIACMEALSYTPDMDPEEEVKHVYFMRHLARYFARGWSAPQPLDPNKRNECHAEISRRLALLKTSTSSIVAISIISELETILPHLFANEYPQVLSHGDFTKTNILVNPDTYEITGIVDWSLAAVQPFGLELDCLFLVTGCMDLRGWHNYTCRPRLLEAFWVEFWTVSGIEDGVEREKVRCMAEAARMIGAILRYSFERNPDGGPSEVLSKSEAMLCMLSAWLGGDNV
ncbi:hypothetical protein BO78DRAFT_448090 [Aspergillus sclerotiicarbonarius CBS 121057]|uniref:Aminoglycoside phosphotransferase domain-containing protein n=1 Tax=Aspergillus sclerotiicarbonarius (strain CBS 121057 / IBT 28362) TaxID=1448318 RepID=A0A319EAN5_ASPSB|nr:hypothetical protein BO78DRAFT_448090 [Aspergillus sclerotiicarbonarius CBS 121057]